MPLGAATASKADPDPLRAMGKDGRNMTVGVNYPIPDEIHYKAKRTAEFLGVSLKQFVEMALLEKAQRHAADIAAAPPNPYKRRL